MVAAKRIVAAVAATPIQIGATKIRVTTSAGVCRLGAGQDGAALVAEADAALYEAKTSGRNRAVARGRRLGLVSRGGAARAR